MIAIIAAMQEELNEILVFGDKIEKIKIQNNDFYKGYISGKEVVVCLSGIGKVNSAISTTMLFENFNIDKVINIGSAGSLVGSIGDLVIALETTYSDFDLTVFGYEKGQVPGRVAKFKSSEYLINKMSEVLVENDVTYHKGLIATADKFITEKTDVEAIAYEMEANSIAQVCDTYKKEFIVVRAVSDVINGGNSVDFTEFLKLASVNSAKIVKELINKL